MLESGEPEGQVIVRQEGEKVPLKGKKTPPFLGSPDGMEASQKKKERHQ